MKSNSAGRRLRWLASGFYRESVESRQEMMQQAHKVDKEVLSSGGLSLQGADLMVENVIGLLSMPLGVLPCLRVNGKEYSVPMCVEEPSVIAACNSAASCLNNFVAESGHSHMVGQVHLPLGCQSGLIQSRKLELIAMLNQHCASMVKRGGGVMDVRVRSIGETETVCELLVNVCDAMGANIVNACCERTKEYLTELGVTTGIAILTNYCTERIAKASFELPISALGRTPRLPRSESETVGSERGGSERGGSERGGSERGGSERGGSERGGREVAMGILGAYGFACRDMHRAVTHNKGIMNGVDAVCLATGQDWRAVEASSHAYACRTGSYLPLSHYELVTREGKEMLRGSLELPLSVGSVGGALAKNPLYQTTMQILGHPSAQELSQIMVCVGLAQNFAALRALAVEGIQAGHMKLHARPLALSEGVPPHLLPAVCAFMRERNSYSKQTIRLFKQTHMTPKL